MAPVNGLPKKLGEEGTAPDTPGSSPRHADYTEGSNSPDYLPPTSLSIAGALLPTQSAVKWHARLIQQS